MKQDRESQEQARYPLPSTRFGYIAAFLAAFVVTATYPAVAQDPTLEACAVAGEGPDQIAVCGYVYTDTNGNGSPDAGEGQAGVTVWVGGVSTTTDVNGYYEVFVNAFTGLVTVTADWPDVSPPSSGVDVADQPLPLTNFIIGSDTEDGTVPNPCDFLTSGGFVVSDAGKKVTFGIHGGCKNGEFWGHLNVVDHATGYHINSTEITGYLVPSGSPNPYVTREICGLATTNNPADPSSVPFRVRLTDNGEPGSLDLFGIRLGTGGYHISSRLLSALKPGGGNIQLHDPNPSTTLATGTSPECWGVPSPD
jgi:hypothetical protein